MKHLLLVALATLPLHLHAQDTTPHTALAVGHGKFLGSAYSPSQSTDFIRYWNKVTPENAGKWGEVEKMRDRMDWRGLDEAYRFAKDNGLPFQMHVMVWGNQQPEWIETLPVAEQREEIEEWFAAVAQRYPQLDFVEVVNEPLNDPPTKDDEGGGHYIDALGGSGKTGWDWIITSYRLARTHFPNAKLLINDYNITNKPDATRRYREIIDLLRRDDLLDGIGVQAHAFATKPGVPMSVHQANLDLLAASGLPIYVTELDIDGATDEEQLKDYQRIFPLFWEHPAVRGITLWGFRPGLWREKEDATLVRADGSERPAMAWLRRYLRGEAKAPPVHGHTVVGRIERFDHALDALVPADAVVERLAEGFTWSEGPAWIDDGKYLLFTDVPGNTMYRWSQDEGLGLFERPSGYTGLADPAMREAGANGLLPVRDGGLLLADSGNRSVVRMDLASRKRVTLASRYQGKRLNSPNDLAQRGDGNVYFTDPPYGLTGLDASPRKELAFNGVYRIDRDGTVHLIDDRLSFPNGIALSPDESTLYVSNSDAGNPVWMAYALDAKGNASDRHVFADASDLAGPQAPGVPDGLCVTADGHLFASAPGGMLVFAPDGRRLGRIATGQAVSNCALGDDGRTLYLTSVNALLRVRLSRTPEQPRP
ncbi:endo-1,4-beta-xylanase [Lysobacter cavernae]|uniref:Endo-1,4-beta-xylanase n=1 Tax=Lysobacter cavernae TaxID=1685901 RepID=A0ABV7RJQ6_9GAMM